MIPYYSATVEGAKASLEAIESYLHTADLLKSDIVNIIQSNLDIALQDSYQVFSTGSGPTGLASRLRPLEPPHRLA